MSAPAPSFSRLSDAAEYLIGRNFGVIRFVLEVPREPGAPEFFHYSAQAASTEAFSRQVNFGSTGGASSSRDLAIAKAIGEAVERYCAAIYDVADLPVTAMDKAGFECVHPDEFALYAPEQFHQPDFPWAPFTPDTPVRWKPALDFAADKTVHVPACMVQIPYTFYTGTGEIPITQPISTGVACHCSPAEAANAGIYEVVERDAFTIAWQAKTAPPKVSVESLSDENFDLVSRFERCGSKVTVFDITTDNGIPTLLSVQRSCESDAPALTFAAATDLNPEKAMRKSLEELAHTRRYCQDILNGLPRLEPVPGHTNIREQQDHLNFYSDHRNARLADFLFESEFSTDFDGIENQSTGRPADDLAILSERVRQTGHRVLLCDLTTEDIRGMGLAVVRAVIPGYHPLFMGHPIRALGGTRLWTVPQKLGHKGIDPEAGDNPAPHPYP